ncbi:MAG: tRNA (guanosine(46)-N7)-methyltransferase TrmB [Actinomycetes bacterium]
MSTLPAATAPVRSYKRRARRLTTGQAGARSRLWQTFGVYVDGTPLDLTRLFGRDAPVVLEIGFGMGEATAAMAAAQPGLDVLAVDVHTPGQGALLRRVEDRGLTNLRVGDGDALVLLRSMLGSASLAEVRVFFPDPWPKRRHWKRRLVSPEFADLVADRLVPGGRLHVATDWRHYAVQVRAVLAEHPAYDVVVEVPWRARTCFEARGLAAGRPAHDVVAVTRTGRATAAAAGAGRTRSPARRDTS